MKKSEKITRKIEDRDGIQVMVVRVDRKVAKKIPFSLVEMSSLFDSDRPSELWVNGNDQPFLSNLDSFQQKRKAEQYMLSRYLGPYASIPSHISSTTDRTGFERSWRNSLRLFAIHWVKGQLGLEGDLTVLRDEVNTLAGYLGSMEGHVWGTWDRLPHILADDFLIAVDEGFARVLTASSRTLQESDRAKVELLWRGIDDRREIVKAFIHEHLPPEYAAKLTSNADDDTTFAEVDVHFLLVQAVTEHTRTNLRVLDPDHLNFPWETETHRLLGKLERGILSLQQRGHDVRSIFSSVVQVVTNSDREILLAGKQVEEIFAGHTRRDSVRRAYLDLMASQKFSARGLVEEMLASYAPSLLDLLRVEDVE